MGPAGSSPTDAALGETGGLPTSMRQEEAKRRRRSSAEGTSRKRPRHIEEISLIDDDDNSITATLQKQREEQVRAQTQAGVKVLKLSNLSCTVCLDTPKDLTATSCGHTFCRACLYDWLDAGVSHRRQTCPTCRKTISKSKNKLDTIPLEIKLRPKASTPAEG